jgi:hypothetical protein
MYKYLVSRDRKISQRFTTCRIFVFEGYEYRENEQLYESIAGV